MHTKTMALVLKNANYRDYDRMLTLFSGDMGRVDVLARGCRRQNSPLMPLSSVFACGEFYLAQKGDRYYLEQGVLKDSFFELRGKIYALTVAMTMAEVAERVVMPEQPNKRLFALMVPIYFFRIACQESTGGLLMSSTWLIKWAGIRPRLSSFIISTAEFTNSRTTAWASSASSPASQL